MVTSNPDWFAPRLVAPGVWRVSEPGHVSSWLVEGSERAALIDSGLGIFSIAEIVRGLTDKPVGVVNTHNHYDHIGGNGEFADIAIHEAGAGLIAQEINPEFLGEYLKIIPAMYESSLESRAADEAGFAFLVTPDEWVRPLPEGFDFSSWRIPGVEATRRLHDGDRIGLGGRTLEVVHAPGHTGDSICLSLEAERMLFTGDTVNSGRIFAHGPDADPALFASSTAMLAERFAGKVRLVCMAHHLRPLAEGPFLSEVAEAFDYGLNAESELEAVSDDFGDPALLVRRGRAQIYLPDPDRPVAKPGDVFDGRPV